MTNIIRKMLDPPDVAEMYDCSQCSHRTASVFQLDHHIQRKHNHVYAAELFHAIVEPEQFPCVCCDYKSYYQLVIYEHCKQAHHPRFESNESTSLSEGFVGYACDYCRYVSDMSLSLIGVCKKVSSRSPQDTTNGVGSEELPNLNRPDIRPSRVDAYVSSKPTCDSSEGIYIFKCSHCSYQTRYKSAFKRHMLQHATDEEINWSQCDQCSYRSKIKGDLKRHVLQHATDEEISWFQCNHCSYRAKLNYILKRHMWKHATDEEINWFQCSHCSYRAKQKYDLKRHMSKHTTDFATDKEISRFQCSHCSYRSAVKRNFKRHMLKHTRDEEINWFQCKHCSFRAKLKNNLKRHMLQHATNDEISWFYCHQCSYRSKIKGDLKRHVLQHATDEDISWFQCNHCSYRSKHNCHLKRHMLKHFRAPRRAKITTGSSATIVFT